MSTSMQPNKITASRLEYPFYISLEQEGQRCIMRNGVAYDEDGRRIQDQLVQDILKGLNNLDGYITYQGEDKFTYTVVDITDETIPFKSRIIRLKDWYMHKVNRVTRNYISLAMCMEVLDENHLKQLVHQYSDRIDTYINVKYHNSLYVWRRSTDQEGSWLKVNCNKLRR